MRHPKRIPRPSLTEKQIARFKRGSKFRDGEGALCMVVERVIGEWDQPVIVFSKWSKRYRCWKYYAEPVFFLLLPTYCANTVSKPEIAN